MKIQTTNSRGRLWLSLGLGLITFAFYLPSVRFDFLDYDDQQYVTENLVVRAGLTLKGLAWAFGYHAGNWHPLTWLSHMLDCQIYGLHPAGHHLTNVLLHTANTVLLFLILSGMTTALWRSAIVAALFGWHPLHVESVAWIAERKDGLSAFFFLLTLWAYSRYVASQSAGKEKFEIRNSIPQARDETNPKNCLVFYALAMFLFALGLMSKPMVVTLPFVLLLLDIWPLRRFQFPITNYQSLTRLCLEKVPFFILSAIACALTVLAQNRFNAVVSTAALPVSTRVTHALVAYLHYFTATFFPRHLAAYYPYEKDISTAVIVLAAITLTGITFVAIRFVRNKPYLMVGWLWFVGMLVPVIGLVQVGEQAWADRYTYLPGIGLFLALVWGGSELFQTSRSGAVRSPSRACQSRPTLPTAVGRGVLTAPRMIGVATAAILITLTSLQLRYWKNTRTLFEHAAAVTHNNHMAVTLLGSLYAKEGKLDEAIERYHTAVRWQPGYPEAHFFLANALDQQGKLDAAIDEYKQALWFIPMQEQTHIFLGAALAKRRKFDEASSHYLAALKLNPESAVAHNNLARLLQTEGRADEAMEHYSLALKFDPGLAQAHNNLGVLLLSAGKTTEGIRELREALRLNPGDFETEYNLARALNEQQQWSEAAELLGKLLEKRRDDPNVHCQLAIALTHLQRTREAMSHYASALLIQPDHADALDGLSWILATAQNESFRNGTEAARMAERACELTSRKNEQKLKTLAAAYAECGRYSDAVSTIQSVLRIAPSSKASDRNESQAMLEAFEANKPWRDPEIK